MLKIISYPISVLFYLCFASTLVVFHLGQWVGFIFFGYKGHKKVVDALNWTILKVLHILGTRFSFTIEEKIPENVPLIIVSNHQSTWETLAFQTIFPAHTWVLKRELLWLPVFGWSLALLKPIIINRGDKLNAIKKVINQGADRLNKGISVVIYPEGTRQPYGELGAYQNGGSAIAKKTGHSITPVYHNAGRLWPKGSFLKKPGVITIVIGEAISNSNLKTSEVTDQIRKWTLVQENKFK